MTVIILVDGKFTNLKIMWAIWAPTFAKLFRHRPNIISYFLGAIPMPLNYFKTFPFEIKLLEGIIERQNAQYILIQNENGWLKYTFML